jgi:hypothetical protein
LFLIALPAPAGAHLLTTFPAAFSWVLRRARDGCAREGVDHPRYLLRLIELELIDRERRTVKRRICAAWLSHHVSILTMNGDSYRLKQSAGRRRAAARTEQNQAKAAAPEAGEIKQS